MSTILGLDASSTMIGFCLLQNNRVLSHGEIKLPAANIAARCEAAQRELILLLDACPCDAVAIEAVVWRFPNSTIPQSFVHGAILAMCHLHDIAWLEIEPAKAKRALCGRGNGSKEDMQLMAADYGVYGEHASDSLGVALAAVGRVVVEAVAL